MGQNDKSFGADPDSGVQLLGSIPLEVPNPSTNADRRMALPPESPEASESDPGCSATEAGTVLAPDEIARDMGLLAKLVTWRRRAKSETANGQDQGLPADPSNDAGGLVFAAVGIALQDEDEVQIVGSVAQAVEYLTTKWPIRYGDAFEEALQACIDGVKGRASPEQVRSAFVNAAVAAGLRVIP
ncbi:DUF982 domain-containing protein [Rhizobium sp. NPDC090279]|uniref:DUF982 domain-containing protein n=1 Tax=Rhizobium sp. NPDC090279 TaxID=3364499 RepID=UPI00383B3FE2